MDKWKSRKLIAGALLLAVGVGVELLGPRGLTETLAGFLVLLGGTYFAGNVGEHLATKPSGASGTNDAKLDTVIKMVGDAQVGGVQSYDAILKALQGILNTQQHIIKKGRLE